MRLLRITRRLRFVIVALTLCSTMLQNSATGQNRFSPEMISLPQRESGSTLSPQPDPTKLFASDSSMVLLSQPRTVMVECAGKDDSIALAQAVTAARDGWVVIKSGKTCAGTDVTIPNLRIEKGGLLKPATLHTITISKSFDAGPYQTFTNALAGQGTVSFRGNRVLAEVYPQWWGAVGDDSTDCTAAIQAALTAHPNVHITQSVFRITGTKNAVLNLPEGHNLYGDGPSSVIHMAGSSTGIQNNNDTTIRDLTLRGPSNGTKFIGHEIAIQGNALIAGPYSRPINGAQWRGLRSKINKLVIENWGGNAISIVGDSEVSDCVIRNVGSEGVLVFGDGNNIHDNHISRTLGWGIDLQGSNNSINHNTLTNAGNSNPPWPFGNDTGVIVLNGDQWADGNDGNRIDSNTIEGSTNVGIQISASKNFRVVGTEITGNIINNVLSSASGVSAAIDVQDNGKGGSISKTIINANTIYNSGQMGIQTWGTRSTVISNNKINKTGNIGIEATSHAGIGTEDVTIMGNVIKMFSQSGISVTGVKQATITNNIVTDVSGAPSELYIGMKIGADTKDYTVTGNTIALEPTHGYGFFITHTASHGTVSGNRVSTCRVALYYDSTGDYLNIVNNDFSNGNSTVVSIAGTRTNVFQK